MAQEKTVFGTPSNLPPIEISGNTKVKGLKEQFKAIFGLTLRVYMADGTAADDSATLATIRVGAKATEATVHLRQSSKASSVPVFFKRELGLIVDVFSAGDTELPDKDISLKAAAEGEGEPAPAAPKKEKAEKAPPAEAKPKAEKTPPAAEPPKPKAEPAAKEQKPKSAPYSWKYDEDAKTLTISGTGEMPDYAEKDEGAAPWTPEKQKIRKIVVENGITSIGAWAFWDCKKITEISLPDSVEKIGGRAFHACDYLAEIKSNAKIIGDAAFRYCKSLTNVKFDRAKKIGTNAFWGCELLNSVSLLGADEMGSGVFRDCLKLRSLYLGEDLEKIGKEIFSAELVHIKIYLKCEFPPVVDTRLDNLLSSSKVIDGVYRYTGAHSYTVFIPKGTENRYAVAAVWKDLKRQAEG